METFLLVPLALTHPQGSFKISYDEKRQKEVTDTLKEIMKAQADAAVSYAKTTTQIEAL
jgi:hypothetical protein